MALHMMPEVVVGADVAASEGGIVRNDGEEERHPGAARLRDDDDDRILLRLQGDRYLDL